MLTVSSCFLVHHVWKWTLEGHALWSSLVLSSSGCLSCSIGLFSLPFLRISLFLIINTASLSIPKMLVPYCWFLHFFQNPVVTSSHLRRSKLCLCGIGQKRHWVFQCFLYYLSLGCLYPSARRLLFSWTFFCTNNTCRIFSCRPLCSTKEVSSWLPFLILVIAWCFYSPPLLPVLVSSCMFQSYHLVGEQTSRF